MFRLLLFLIVGLPVHDFRSAQMQYARVKDAYAVKKASAEKLFRDKQLDIMSSEIFIRVHKLEKELELWARKKGEGKFILLKTYSVCNLSGNAGPKLRVGDLQTPEGFYYIDRFNPSSSYHLSLGINYPNTCDKYNCGTADPGGDIFIHGKCVTIGCLPMTDDQIKEIYVIAVEAKNYGQKKIPVAIFPCNMNSTMYEKLLSDNSYTGNYTFWSNLKVGYDYFEKNRNLPVVSDSKGKYSFR